MASASETTEAIGAATGRGPLKTFHREEQLRTAGGPDGDRHHG